MSLEFTEICDEFNDMLEQLNKTKIQMYEQEIEKKSDKAEVFRSADPAPLYPKRFKYCL